MERPDARRLIAILQALVLPVLAVAFVGFFAVANAFFPVIHVSLENPYGDAARMLAYAGIFLPSYAIFGALLALYFEEGAQRIGRLYFFDLAGAASGCLLAPLVLTWAGLPPAIMTVLFGALALLAATPLARRRLAVGAGAAGFCVVAFLAWRGSVFEEHPDVARLSRYVLSDHARNGAEEVRVRWNDLARTSLVRADAGDPNANAEAWGIVQDDGISNVKVARWDPAATPADILPASLHHTLPFLMGHEPERILVLFAGVGRDMVELDGMAQGRADITGVELNPAVVDLYRDPLLAGMNLRAFHARPNMHLVVREGRDFLDNDRGRYDLAVRGHERLDQRRAHRPHAEVPRHLRGHGVVPRPPGPGPGLDDRVREPARDPQGREPAAALRRARPRRLREGGLRVRRPRDPGARQHGRQAGRAHAGRDRGHRAEGGVVAAPAEGALLALGRGRAALRGRRPGAYARAARHGRSPVRARGELARLRAPAREGALHRPALRFELDQGLHRPALRRGLGRGHGFLLDWAWACGAAASGACLGRGCCTSSWPASRTCAWRSASSRKAELFLGSPLYAVAVILALFLASNGLGAYLQDRLRVFRGPATLVLPTVAAIAWGVLATHLCNARLLSLPLPLKILCVALCVVPAGTFLGMFYPFGVERVVEAGRRAAVPATYAIATLSSVWGASWAMTAITNLGFSAVILMGAAGYALTGALYLVARRLRPSPTASS